MIIEELHPYKSEIDKWSYSIECDKDHSKYTIAVADLKLQRVATCDWGDCYLKTVIVGPACPSCGGNVKEMTAVEFGNNRYLYNDVWEKLKETEDYEFSLLPFWDRHPFLCYLIIPFAILSFIGWWLLV